MARRASRTFNPVLLDAAYAPATLKKYNTAVNLFLSSCLALREDPSSASDFDQVLHAFITDLYVSGGHKSTASDLLYGLLRLLPELKGRLPLSTLALKGWTRLNPATSYPPLTWDLCCLVSFRLAANRLWSLAVGTLLAFDCLLRVSELVGLRVSDIADSGDPRVGTRFSGMALRLRQTKTGPNQWVIVRSPAVVTLVRTLLQDRGASQSAMLFPVSSDVFRRRFKKACAQLGLSDAYVPHSLRHGGATALFISGEGIEDIMLRGRWASNKSARRYIQAGPSLLLQQNVPSAAAALASDITPHIRQLLSLMHAHSQ
jgi:integrase